MFHNTENIDKFLKLKKSDLDGFTYISVHAPIYFGRQHDAEYKRALQAIENKHKEINFACVVLHPDQFEDFEFLKKFNIPYAIENMDNRKNKYKYVSDFLKVYEQLDAGLVLDLNHIFVNDNSMSLTNSFMNKYGEKLKEIHLSGFESLHEPLHRTKQYEILDAIPDRDIPIILESGGNPPQNLIREYNFVKEYLTKT